MSTHSFPIVKSEQEWREELGSQAFDVLRNKGTERARTGEYDKFYPKEGYFACRGCGNPLYRFVSYPVRYTPLPVTLTFSRPFPFS